VVYFNLISILFGNNEGPSDCCLFEKKQWKLIEENEEDFMKEQGSSVCK